jgi:hypothetical protein
MDFRIVLLLCAWVAEASPGFGHAGPFTPAPLVAGTTPFRASFDYFCVNYTTQTVTFIGDVPVLYNTSGLPWNQFVSVGAGNVLSKLSGSNFACSSLSSVPSLPTALPVPVSAFVNGINAFNDFRFPAQTGTQDTYQTLNTHGIVQAVQIIQDATTNFQEMLRFFFKVNFATLGSACTSLGSSETQVTSGSTLLQYTSNVPIVSIARSGAGTVLADSRFFSATQTPNNDYIITVTGGNHYQLQTFLESTFLDSSQCPTGQTQLVLQFGMEYTSLNSTFLVQGPRLNPGLTIAPNCYNITTRGVVRPPCTQGVCVSRVQLQTECRTALANGLTFASCDVGQPAAEELNEVFFDSRASYCPVAVQGCAQNGTGFTMLFYPDKVRASLSFKAASQFLEVVQFYSASTSPLTSPVASNYTLLPGQTVWMAAFFAYPEIQRHFLLSISNSTLFNITGYNSAGQMVASLTYPQLVKAGVIAVGVKATRGAGMVACDLLPGCDSLALDADAASMAFPGASYLTFNVSTAIPGGYSGVGTLGSLVVTSATQSLNTTASLITVLTYSTKQSTVMLSAWVLTGVGGFSLLVIMIASCYYVLNGSSPTTYSSAVAMSSL